MTSFTLTQKEEKNLYVFLSKTDKNFTSRIMNKNSNFQINIRYS